MNIKSNIAIMGGALLGLLLLIDIARSLARTGPSCDDCGGALDVAGHVDDSQSPATFYRCRDCSRYMVLPDPPSAQGRPRPAVSTATTGESL